jgi:hypothetical protein
MSDVSVQMSVVAIQIVWMLKCSKAAQIQDYWNMVHMEIHYLSKVDMEIHYCDGEHKYNIWTVSTNPMQDWQHKNHYWKIYFFWMDGVLFV